MTHFVQHSAAAIAAIFIVSTSFAAVVTVPPAEAATFIAAPVLA